jgi:hypothetical protein
MAARHQSRRRPTAASRTPLKYYRSGSASSDPPVVPKSKSKAGPKGLISWLLKRSLEVLVIGIVLAAAAFSLLVKPQPKIEVSSELYRPATVYQQAAAAELKAIKNRTKISLDESAIITALQRQFPEITGGTVKLPLFSQQPTVKLDIGLPTFTLASASTNYIINSYGTVVGLAKDYPDAKKLPTVVDQTAYPIRVGTQALSSASVAFVNNLVLQLGQAKVKIGSITLPPRPQELNLREAKRPYVVKFYLGAEPLNQIGQFLAARQHFAKNHITPSSYLDVRVPGKVFYK